MIEAGARAGRVGDRGEENEGQRREEKADKLPSLDSLGTTPWDSARWPGQYPEEPGCTEDWFPEAPQGEAGDGCEQRKQKESLFSELLWCAGPYARQFTDSISFNHHNNPVRKVSRLPLKKPKLRVKQLP